MFNAVLSDDGTYVTLFHEDGKVEEMEVFEFMLAYGAEILEKENEARTSDGLVVKTTPQTFAADVKNYWKAFRLLVATCGDYAQKTGYQRNSDAGVLRVQIVVHDYFGTSNSNSEPGLSPEDVLAKSIDSADRTRMMALKNLDRWSRRLGFNRFSMPEDVEKYGLKRSDADIMLEHLAKPDFRKRIYYRIDKYANKGELKSPAEVVLEVLKSYKKKSHSEPS